jgi:hypothetical protein
MNHTTLFMLLPSKLRMAIVSTAMLAAFPVDVLNPYTGMMMHVDTPASDVVQYFFDEEQESTEQQSSSTDTNDDDASDINDDSTSS